MLGSLLFACAALAPKPVAVMIHGAGGGGWEYRFWKPVFEQAGYKVVAPDLVPVKGGLEKTTFNDYVDQICRAGGSHPTVLVGASMGGILVLKAAERLHPKAIILCCSTSPKEANPPAGAPKKYPPIVLWKGGPYKDTVDSMPDSDEAARKFAWPRWRDESGAVLNAISAGISAHKPSCPVLSMIPGADDTIPPAQQERLAEWCGADVMRFHGMSHVGVLMSTRGAEVATLAVEWLRAHSAP